MPQCAGPSRASWPRGWPASRWDPGGVGCRQTATDRFGYFAAEVDVSLRRHGSVDPGRGGPGGPVPRHQRPARHALQRAQPGSGLAVRRDLRRRRHDPAHRRPAGARHDPDHRDGLRLRPAPPFAGAPELYRALAAGPGSTADNPLFYVSSTPWPLHDFLTGFLAHRDFPLGPLLLRDVPVRSADRSHHAHKRAHIEEILRVHPGLGFVLLGDSGQHDPEIYAGVVRDHPGRIWPSTSARCASTRVTAGSSSATARLERGRPLRPRCRLDGHRRARRRAGS